MGLCGAVGGICAKMTKDGVNTEARESARDVQRRTAKSRQQQASGISTWSMEYHVSQH
jgi:hypothetical protein